MNAIDDGVDQFAMRSKLFVPGNRPALFSKALHSGADVVCFDLEDAVLPAQKGKRVPMYRRFCRLMAGPNGPSWCA